MNNVKKYILYLPVFRPLYRIFTNEKQTKFNARARQLPFIPHSQQRIQPMKLAVEGKAPWPWSVLHVEEV